MRNRYDIIESLSDLQIPEDVKDQINNIISGIITLAVRASDSNSDSN
ncbi:hypothetical protein ACFLTB_04235 [Chloroflexota bacterium]